MTGSERSGGQPAFNRDFLAADEGLTVIGGGELGGKAKGLSAIQKIVAGACPPGTFPGIDVGIPRLTVLGTDVFEQFIKHNGLEGLATDDLPDDRIAHAFQKAELPPLIVGDLRAVSAQMHTPLAVRSSSLLEDALQHPFAGTYATKMIANNQADVATRFKRLSEAVKFVWASTYFRDAKRYMRVIGRAPADERMAVIIQEVVGQRLGDRFYPTVSGVIRTHNFYPTGPARPEDGVVNLALGLGKTIVDGGISWTYSPAYPRHAPPYGSVAELMKNSQTKFWAINVGSPPMYDPINEAEYLVETELSDAEYDGTLRWVASTYDPASDRLTIGTGRDGPRVLTFAPLLDLEDVPLNRVIERLAARCKAAVGSDVEIEFALTIDVRRRDPARFGFLQLRPTLVGDEHVEIADEELRGAATLLATETVLGHGAIDDLADIVYVKPAAFEAQHTRAVAAELEPMNQTLVDAGRRYVLLGFGRWGSSDPWLGIPVTWPQICGARVIVEATLPAMDVDPSQGSHFFHNMTSFRVCYLTVRHNGSYQINWDWLAQLPTVAETRFVRHVRAPRPLQVKVDGRGGRGVILHW